MANARMTLSTIFTAISGIAQTAVAATDAMSDGLNMVNKSIKVAALKQAEEQVADLERHSRTYTTQVLREVQQFNNEINAWLDERPGQREEFTALAADFTKSAAEWRKKLA